MNIAIVGTGYVGLVSGTCFSEMGINVICIDVDEKKIEDLKNGIIPIYEPGLEEMVHKNMQAGRLKFATDLAKVLDDVEIVFSAVGTPPDEDGSADLKYVLAVAKTIGENIKKYTVVVTKSTVPVGTAKKVKATIQAELDRRGEKMSRLYKPFMVVNDRLIFTDIPSAEMIKYAANSMLATRISFMNDIANLCELVGADVNMVRKGIGSDTRIGKKFLYAGCGYGGSCFPKDVKALIKTAQRAGYNMEVLQAVESVNEKQKSILFNKLMKHYNGDIKDKTIAMWGLAFKPETDDMREAPALVLIDKIIEAGAKVKVYDPIAIPECKRRIGDKVTYCKDMYDAAVDVDALMLVTEWKEFRMPSLDVLTKTMTSKVIIDGRNIYDANEMKENEFVYYKIG